MPSIKTWPQQDRPREKLLTQGSGALTEAELIAIFLRSGCKGKNAVELARDLLQQFNGLRGVLNAPYQNLTTQPGLGLSKYVQLQAALEIGRRYLKETLQRDTVLNNTQVTKNYLTLQLRDRQQEVFACLFLDNQHQVMAYEELFYGSIHSASVYPREVVKRALHHNAAAVILAHNHPSGIAEPSDADIHLTSELQKALALIDVRIVDHFVIGEGTAVSFAEKRLL